MARLKAARSRSLAAPARIARNGRETVPPFPRPSPPPGAGNGGIETSRSASGGSARSATAPTGKIPGLRERKKARLRQQIIERAVKLFRERGYTETRVEDIVRILGISQPTFFRYFPSKDAVLAEVGRRGFTCICEHLQSELSSEATAAARLRHLYRALARETEADRPLWQAVVLSGAMDPVHSPEMRERKEAAIGLLGEILAQGQEKGEITRSIPADHMAEFMEGLYNTVVRQWAVNLTGPHKLSARVQSAVEFFLRGVQP
jgi:AcrR family transcriptional regulator